MKKLTIILLAAAVLLAGLSILSGLHAVKGAEEAISAIGKVTFSEESRAAIEQAASAYLALDTNIGLDKKVANYEQLRSAEAEYVRLAIKTASVADQRKLADGYSDEDIRAKIADARAAVDTYCTTDTCTLIPNLSDLTALEDKYAAQETEAPAPAEAPAETETVAVPLC